MVDLSVVNRWLKRANDLENRCCFKKLEQHLRRVVKKSRQNGDVFNLGFAGYNLAIDEGSALTEPIRAISSVG